MRIVVNNLKSKIFTDNPDILLALRERLTYKVEGAEHSHAYKKGYWDGTKSFLDLNGEFRTGILDRVLADLSLIGCTPNIEYGEDTVSEDAELTNIEGFTYYDYQEELIKRSLKKKRCIIQSPTGSGKTLITAGLVKALEGKRMVILFNATLLLKQTYDFLTNECGFTNIGICFGEGYIENPVMLCTVQSIEKIIDSHLDSAEVLIVDECHEFCSGKTTLAAIESFPRATYRFGLTATPPKYPKYANKRVALEGAFGSVVTEVSTKELIDQGKLTKPIVQLIDRKYDASGHDMDLGYLGLYDEYIVNNDSRNQDIKTIVKHIKSTNERARIVILTKSLDHGRILKDLLGGYVSYLEGADSLGERYRVIGEFIGHKGNSVLIGTKILQTGVNIAEITHFINARGMKSETSTTQALGRAIRKHDSKQVVYVYDFLDKERILETHSNERRKEYKREGHDIEVITL